MKFNAVINSNTLRKTIPNTIKVSDDESLSVKETAVIIKEIDYDTAPFCCKKGEEKFSVGVRALVERRVYKANDNGSAGVSVEVSAENDYIGDYVYLPEDASLKDAMNAINDLVCKISNPNALT